MRRTLIASCLVSAIVSASLTLLIGTWLAPMRGTPSVLTAQRFEVRDAEGKLKAYLGGPDYNDSLTILGPEGAERIKLLVLADGTAFFVMNDAEGVVRARMYVNRQGYSDVALLGADGRPHHQVALPPYDVVP